MYNPIKTLKTNTIGTLNMLGEYMYLLNEYSSYTVYFKSFRSQTSEMRMCWFIGFQDESEASVSHHMSEFVLDMSEQSK